MAQIAIGGVNAPAKNRAAARPIPPRYNRLYLDAVSVLREFEFVKGPTV